MLMLATHRLIKSYCWKMKWLRNIIAFIKRHYQVKFGQGQFFSYVTYISKEIKTPELNRFISFSPVCSLIHQPLQVGSTTSRDWVFHSRKICKGMLSKVSIFKPSEIELKTLRVLIFRTLLTKGLLAANALHPAATFSVLHDTNFISIYYV